jgi:hypothetical protein
MDKTFKEILDRVERRRPPFFNPLRPDPIPRPVYRPFSSGYSNRTDQPLQHPLPHLPHPGIGASPGEGDVEI